MVKKLNIDAMRTELAESAFFRDYQKPAASPFQPASTPERADSSPAPVAVSRPVLPSLEKPQQTVQDAKTTNAQQTKAEKFDKYSTYLRAGYKKELKIIALEKDCKDYEVLDEAITMYIKSLQEK